MPIVDPQIDALRAVLQPRLNAILSADVRAQLHMSSGDQAVNVTYPFDLFPPGAAGPDATVTGNTVFPALAIWRSDDEIQQETWEDDICVATVAFKYILPDSAEQSATWPILRAFVQAMRRVLQNCSHFLTNAASAYHDGRLDDLAALRAVRISQFATKIKAHYGYDGPGRQGLYPTAMGTFEMHAFERWDQAGLQPFESLEVFEHIHGDGQDGDAAPAINPLVTMRKPPSLT